MTMIKVKSALFLLYALIVRSACIWPPPYDIKLNQGATFVISELSDEFYDDEDEMIKPDESKRFDDGKYSRIHQLALRYNKKELDDWRKPLRNIRKIKERNFDIEDPIPWQGGFINKNGDFIQPDNENVYYLNEMAKSLIDAKIDQKRSESAQTDDKSENYDYNALKVEYNAEIKKALRQNDTLNFTDVKEDESVKDALETVVEFKEPKNCTVEETRGIGIAAIKCVLNDFKTTKNKQSLLYLMDKLGRITLIWLCVYLSIAIPCWCQRGWCCCCFSCCCKCCRPLETIDVAKKFFMQNPQGVLHTESGEKLQYPPTNYEIHAQKRLGKALFSL